MTVVEAAWEIALRDGLYGVNREKIAARCGISTGSVSSLYGNMDPIYQSVIDRAHKEKVKLKWRIRA